MKIVLSAGPRILNKTPYNTEDLERIFAVFTQANIARSETYNGALIHSFEPYTPSATAMEEFSLTRWTWNKPEPRPLLVRFTRNADEPNQTKVVGLVNPKLLPLSDIERLSAVSGEGVAPPELIFQIGWRLYEINHHHDRKGHKTTAAQGRDFSSCRDLVRNAITKASETQLLVLRYGNITPDDEEVKHRQLLINAYRVLEVAKRQVVNKQSVIIRQKEEVSRLLNNIEETAKSLGEELVMLEQHRREYDKLKRPNDPAVDLLIDKK